MEKRMKHDSRCIPVFHKWIIREKFNLLFSVVPMISMGIVCISIAMYHVKVANFTHLSSTSLILLGLINGASAVCCVILLVKNWRQRKESERRRTFLDGISVILLMNIIYLASSMVALFVLDDGTYEMVYLTVILVSFILWGLLIFVISIDRWRLLILGIAGMGFMYLLETQNWTLFALVIAVFNIVLNFENLKVLAESVFSIHVEDTQENKKRIVEWQIHLAVTALICYVTILPTKALTCWLNVPEPLIACLHLLLVVILLLLYVNIVSAIARDDSAMKIKKRIQKFILNHFTSHTIANEGRDVS